jgi:tetratricopeptide (TPR) repeat protein
MGHFMEDHIRCFNCHHDIPQGVERCPVCGFSLEGGKVEAIKKATELNSRAQLAETKGDFQEAVRLYTEAVQLFPEFVVAHYNLGIALGKLKDFRGAMESLTRAIGLKNDFAAAYAARGDMWVALGDYASAVRDYSMAIELYPDYAQAYYRRAMALVELGEWERAEKDLQDYLFYKPHDRRARLKLEELARISGEGGERPSQ